MPCIEPLMHNIPVSDADWCNIVKYNTSFFFKNTLIKAFIPLKVFLIPM